MPGSSGACNSARVQKMYGELYITQKSNKQNACFEIYIEKICAVHLPNIKNIQDVKHTSANKTYFKSSKVLKIAITGGQTIYKSRREGTEPGKEPPRS